MKLVLFTLLLALSIIPNYVLSQEITAEKTIQYDDSKTVEFNGEVAMNIDADSNFRITSDSVSERNGQFYFEGNVNIRADEHIYKTSHAEISESKSGYTLKTEKLTYESQ